MMISWCVLEKPHRAYLFFLSERKLLEHEKREQGVIISYYIKDSEKILLLLVEN